MPLFDSDGLSLDASLGVIALNDLDVEDVAVRLQAAAAAISASTS